MPIVKPSGSGKLKYRWYLEPKNAYTNEVIARRIGSENFQDEMLCADGGRHPLWDVPYSFYAILRTNRKAGDRKIRFNVWRQELPGGKIIGWPPAASHTSI